jgi:hypothetical protein
MATLLAVVAGVVTVMVAVLAIRRTVVAEREAGTGSATAVGRSVQVRLLDRWLAVGIAVLVAASAGYLALGLR